ncbi:MAG: winged helix DNA-binding domain-containing protein [Anaerolineaceae bacterium]|nr:winged helix DNA-binding domain-containing protein [Anaerolineaceae bacterium]
MGLTGKTTTTGLRRLYHQRITHPHFKDAAEVVSWLGAMQGQDYLGTKWAFGLRLPGSTDADIEKAIVDGVVMRTWAMRGTLHFVAPDDIHWLLGLLAPRQIAGNKGRYKQLELDEPTLIRSTELIVKALQDGAHLTRPELFDILETNGISTAGQRGVYMLQRAGLERRVYQGEMRGKDTTFHILGEGKTLPKEEALAELALRYFSSRGPATLADYVNWSGLPITEARAGLESVKSKLIEETIDDQTYWLSTEKHQHPEQALYLLPGFDEYILGYKDRTTVVEPEFLDAICPGGNGIFKPTIVYDGQVVGIWQRTLKKKTVEINLQPFRPLSQEVIDKVDAAAQAFGHYLGLNPVIK